MSDQPSKKCPVCGNDLPLWKGINEPKWSEEKQEWIGYKLFCSDECKNSEKGKSIIKHNHSVNLLNKTKEEKDLIQQKRQETCLKKYGVNNTSKVPHIREKISKVKKSKDSTNSNIKRKETCLKKYGVEYNTQIESVKMKKNNTFNQKYKDGHPMRDPKIVNKLKNTSLANMYNEKILKNEDFEPLFSLTEWVECGGATIASRLMKEFKFRCKKCSNIFEQRLWNGFSMIRCPHCNPYHISKPQIEIKEFLEEYGVHSTMNTKKVIYPFEIDIFVHDLNIGIEYNGISFHSFGISKHSIIDNADEENIRKYHLLRKTNLCAEKNIKLFHIFENEWLDETKKDIWKSMILSKVKKTPIKIYARDCKITIVNSSEAKKFLNENHLQGECNSSKLNYGLLHNNELVFLMTLGKPRYSKDIEWEILRIATKKYHCVVGGASKLFKHFIDDYSVKSIISYANIRYSDGDVYNNLNFKYEGNTDLNYWYFKENSFILESRIKYQKFKLKKLLNSFDDSLTEKENMFRNGYRILYDCGNKVYVWRSTMNGDVK